MIHQARGMGYRERWPAPPSLLAEGLTEMRGATSPRLLLELLCARILLPAASTGHDGILARLDRVERRIDLTGGGAEAPAAPRRPVEAPAPQAAGPAPSAPAPSAPAPSAPAPSAPAAVEQDARPSAPAPSAPAPERTSDITRSVGPARTPVPPPAPARTPVPPPAQPSAPAEEDWPEAVRPGEGLPAGAAGVRDPEVAPPTEPEPPAPPTEPTATAQAVGGVTGRALDAAAVRRVWPDVMEEVKRRKRTPHAMLADAQVVAVEGRHLVLAFPQEVLARRFSDPVNTSFLVDSLREVLGVEWEIRCVAGDAASRAQATPPGDGPHAHPAEPPPQVRQGDGGFRPSRPGVDSFAAGDEAADDDDPADAAPRVSPEDAALALLRADLGATELS